MKRDVYLSSVSLEDAKKTIDDLFNTSKYKIEYETIKVKDSLNRVVFDSVTAVLSSPSFNVSAMESLFVKQMHNKSWAQM